MRTLLPVVIAAFAVAPSGCGPSISVQQDWHPDYDFSAIGAYAWLPLRTTPNIGEPRLKRLVAAIDAEMAARQMALTVEEADILLELHVVSEQRLDLTQYGGTAGWDSRRYDTDDLDKGSIMLDVRDAKTRDVVWRAVANVEVDPSATPQEQTERFTKLAKKLFSKFPPPSP